MSAWTEHIVNADAPVRSNVFRRGVVAAAALVVLGSGCGGDDSAASTAPTVAPTSITSAPTIAPTSTIGTTIAPTMATSAITTTLPAARSFGTDGAATFVQGTSTFTLDMTTVPPDTTGRKHADGTATATITMNDPRASGTAVDSWHSDLWGTVYDGVVTQFGTSTLTNDQGTWEGSYTGVYTSKTTDAMMWWYTGTGAYEGLSMVLWITESRSGEMQGIIFPGELPPQFRNPPQPAD